MITDTSKLPKLLDISKYFKDVNGKKIFIGDTLEVQIQRRYEVYGFLDINEHVDTLGVCTLVFDDRYYANLIVLNTISISPSEISEDSVGNIPYLVLKLNKGDVFLNNVEVLQNPQTQFVMWAEFIAKGKPLSSLRGFELSQIFDNVKELTGNEAGINRSLFEMTLAHLYRDKHNKFLQYRYTDMKESPELIAIRSVRYAPGTTTARLVGPYFKEGEVSSLLQTNKVNSPFEDLYRSVPIEEKP